MAECGTVKAKRLLIAVVFINVVACLSTALADGKVFLKYNKQADILQPTQKVYIRWDGAEEKLVIQTKYEGPAEEMVWIVPVPAEPNVKKGDPNLFEKLSTATQHSDISHTYFPYVDTGYAAATRGTRDVVQWRRRIGDYDVTLLKPAGGENALQWLHANQFAVEDRAVPILEDYLKEKWWMVAARIHPDALTDITRDKLAQGLLDPLDMAFPSARCLYPLRLTQFVAGPVEELIYIEGQSHFQPVGSAKGWEMDVFGGPQRITSEDQRHLSTVEFATLAAAGRTTKNVIRHLTKLRKVFQPTEMKSDVVFEKMDYTNLLSLGGNDRIGQAATQYGRHSDPAGIPHLLSLLSARELKRVLPAADTRGPDPQGRTYSAHAAVFNQLPACKHLRSCIWALGEIAVEHGHDRAVEDTLLRCAGHDSQPIRMEAYIALTKTGFSDLGGVLLDRFRQILDLSKEYRGFGWSGDGWTLRSEADVIADWIEQHGVPTDKHTFAEVLMKAIGELSTRSVTTTTTDEWDRPVLYGWSEWLIARAVATSDPGILPVLQKLRESVPDANGVVSFLLKAEAACGSREAVPLLARRMAEDQDRILRERKVRAEGNDSVPARIAEQLSAKLPLEQRPPTYDSLRQRIIRNRGARSDGLDRILEVPAETADAIIRATLSDHELDDGYVLYLLAQIKKPQQRDRETILSLWNKNDQPKQMVIVDVLWLWQDSKTLLALRAQAANEEVLSELDRAVASLNSPQ
jgi:hypothetical protein